MLRPVSGRGPVRRCGGRPGNNHSKKIRKMTLTYIIRETLLMMGFTFVVGVAFAYVLKLMTLFFSYLNGEDLPSLVRRSRIWGRAYRMDMNLYTSINLAVLHIIRVVVVASRA